ncbi:MAG: hypothetical protein ABFS86_15505, partial [Planctomycetota bacterium]
GLEENESHEVTVRVDDANGGPEERTFAFTIDTLPPVLASAEPVDPPPEKGQFLLVTATDNTGKPVVTVKLPDGKERRLNPLKDRPDVYRTKLPTDQWEPGEHELTITARDAVGLTTEQKLTVVVEHR